MNKSHSSNTRLNVLAVSIAVLLLAIFVTEPGASPAPQGKGGTIKPVPTPTPATKKTTPKKPPPAVNPKVNPKAPAKVDDAAATERTYWESIRNSIDPEDFRAYLKKYPNGQFADLAQNRIRALEAAKAQPVSTPTPVPEPAYEWTKVERDLPASVRVVWREVTEGDKSLSFAVPSGWTRTRREQLRHYLQFSFRAPDSPQTNISVQLYSNGIPHTLRNGYAELWSKEKVLIDYRRSQYASQNVSAKLTDTDVIQHPTGRWYTFTADVLDVKALESGGVPSGFGLAASLDAVYPDDVWEKDDSQSDAHHIEYKLKPGSIGAFTRTRHSYAIRQAGDAFIVMLYTAPIASFDEQMLPSVMAALKMSGGDIKVKAASSDSAVDLSKYELEIMIDGERKEVSGTINYFRLSTGKHHITIRAREHKPFDKDVIIEGWGGKEEGYEGLILEVKLERIASSKSAARPN